MNKARGQKIADVLSRIYVPGHIFLRAVEKYCPEDMFLECSFHVPTTKELKYTVSELGYVSSTQRHACVNQLGYALTALLVDDQIGEFCNVSLSDFIALSEGFQMWNVLEHFEHRTVIARDAKFCISMRIVRTRIRQKRLGVVHAQITGAVTGKIEFAVTFP